MLYGRHGAIPAEDVFEDVKLHAPNYSGRMDHLRAVLLRAQLPAIEDSVSRWNQLYDRLAAHFRKMDGVVIPARRQEEFYVGSSIQFRAEVWIAVDTRADGILCSARCRTEMVW